MGELEGKINGSFFGGYNKKSADAYIEELQTAFEKIREELERSQELNRKQAAKLAEAEECYRRLWERSKDQEKIIEQQKNELKTDKNVMDVQKETIRSRGEVIRKQENLLRKEKESVLCLQEEFEKLGEEFDKQGEQIKELEAQLEEKDGIIREDQELIAGLEDKVEKQQWLYEEFFKNEGRVPVSKLEQYVRESMRKKMKRKY